MCQAAASMVYVVGWIKSEMKLESNEVNKRDMYPSPHSG